MGNVNSSLQNSGCIFNIQKFSVHDGPGIRDVVFMKGCPLRCKWCSNPESQNKFIEVGYNQNKCIGNDQCGYCIETCPTGAIKKIDGEKSLISIDRRLCNNCGECVDPCPAEAITLFGKMMTVEDVLKVVQEEQASWRTSGGITVSGGELLMQADFVNDLLRECRKRGIDTAIETSGYGNRDDLKNICQHANLIFYDIKLMDSEKHKAFTGVDNKLILENFNMLSDTFSDTPIIVRTPLIPGVNDSAEDIEKAVEFLAQLPNLKEYELLGYHAFGESKYRQLGREYPLGDVKHPDKQYILQLNQKVNDLLKERQNVVSFIQRDSI